jgi:Fe-S-cluster containining protein
MIRRLTLLDERIEARVRATHEGHAYWPCTRGCDLCCRSLPSLPVISEEEWGRLYTALVAHPERGDIEGAILQNDGVSPVTCPILDLTNGACRLYTARPIACRTYGYYTEHDAGLHCAIVSESIERNDDPTTPVVWGNGEAIQRDLDQLGERRSIREWLELQRNPTHSE